MITRLAAENKKQMLEKLRSGGFSFEDGEIIKSTHDYFIELSDSLRKETGNTYTVDDEEFNETELIVGCFANLVTKNEDLLNGIKGMIIHVDNPIVKIFGE